MIKFGCFQSCGWWNWNGLLQSGSFLWILKGNVSVICNHGGVGDSGGDVWAITFQCGESVRAATSFGGWAVWLRQGTIWFSACPRSTRLLGELWWVDEERKNPKQQQQQKQQQKKQKKTTKTKKETRYSPAMGAWSQMTERHHQTGREESATFWATSWETLS